MAKEKTPCPMSADEFFRHAKPLKLRIQQVDEKGEVLGESVVMAFPKKNKTESYGWHASDKPVITVNMLPLKAQLNCSITLIGSKPEEAQDAS